MPRRASLRGDSLEAAAALVLRAAGYRPHRVRKARIKRGGRWVNLGEDLWGAFDIAGIAHDRPLILVQAGTSAATKRADVDEILGAAIPVASVLVVTGDKRQGAARGAMRWWHRYRQGYWEEVSTDDVL